MQNNKEAKIVVWFSGFPRVLSSSPRPYFVYVLCTNCTINHIQRCLSGHNWLIMFLYLINISMYTSAIININHCYFKKFTLLFTTIHRMLMITICLLPFAKIAANSKHKWTRLLLIIFLYELRSLLLCKKRWNVFEANFICNK